VLVGIAAAAELAAALAVALITAADLTAGVRGVSVTAAMGQVCLTT